MSINIGDIAPEFNLFNHKNEKISLANLRGQTVVLLFFPFANTGVCTKEMCGFRDTMTVYNNLNAKVIGLSVDSPFSLAMWAEKNNFNFDLLSDFNKDVSRAYSALFEVFSPGKYDFIGVSKRAAFVIDKEGVVRYTEVLESSRHEPNYDAIKKVVESLV